MKKYDDVSIMLTLCGDTTKDTDPINKPTAALFIPFWKDRTIVELGEILQDAIEQTIIRENNRSSMSAEEFKVWDEAEQAKIKALSEAEYL